MFLLVLLFLLKHIAKNLTEKITVLIVICGLISVQL